MAFLGFGILLLYLVYTYVNGFYQEHCQTTGVAPADCNLWSRIYNDFVGADFRWIFVSLICLMSSNVLRALQWSMLLEPVHHKPKFYNSFWGVMLGYFANLGLPRMGEFVRSGAMSRYEQIPYEKVLATVVNSRILDLCFLGLTTLVAMTMEWEKLLEFYEYVASNYGFQSIYFALALLGVAFLAFVWILKLPPSQNVWIAKFQKLIASFNLGLLSILKIKQPFKLLSITGLIWVLYILMTYFGFSAYGPTADIQFSAGLVVFVVGALGFVIPSSGGMGTYHALTIIALSFYSISEIDAFAYAMILFVTLQIGANVFFGILSLFLLPRLNAK